MLEAPVRRAVMNPGDRGVAGYGVGVPVRRRLLSLDDRGVSGYGVGVPVRRVVADSR